MARLLLLGILLLFSTAETPVSEPSPAGFSARREGRHGKRKRSRRHHARKDVRRDTTPREAEFEKVFGAGSTSSPEDDTPEQVSREQVTGVVVAHKLEIVECVNRQRSEGTQQTGTLVMGWVVEPNGRTSNVAAATPELDNSPLANCLAFLIKDWTFPKHRSAQEPINFPFKF